jgi:hypothetical protein
MVPSVCRGSAGRRLRAVFRVLPTVSIDELAGLGQIWIECVAGGFVLPGNLVRLQVVQQQSNPVLWRLLKRFGEEAPAPFLVNTSFNLFDEPLVVKPRDAVRSYFCPGVDDYRRLRRTFSQPQWILREPFRHGLL